MGSSSSSTNTSQTTQAINPVALARDNATAVNGVVNGNGSLTQNITTLNADVANHAMDTTLTATQDALLFGANAEKNAYGFADAQSARVLNFASANNDATMSFARASNDATLASARAQNAASLSFATAQTTAAQTTAQKSIDSASSAYQDALQYGARQTGVALDALAGSASMIDTAYKDAKGVLGTNVILVGIGATVLVLYFALRK